MHYGRSCSFSVTGIDVFKGYLAVPGVSVVGTQGNNYVRVVNVCVFNLELAPTAKRNRVDIAVYYRAVIDSLVSIKTGNAGILVVEILNVVSAHSSPTSFYVVVGFLHT